MTIESEKICCFTVIPNCKSNTLTKIIPSSGIVYVTKWIDYSNRHGFGMEYNNGIVGVVFNDGCSVLLSADRRTGRFVSSMTPPMNVVSKSTARSVVDDFCFDMTKVRDDMIDRIKTVNVFANYMDKNLISVGLTSMRCLRSTVFHIII